MPSLSTLLQLSSDPIAISFVDTPPAGVPRVQKSEPAGCGYWRRAAEGEVFYTTADDHKSCPIGAPTQNVALSRAESAALMDMVKMMAGMSYIKLEEVPKIPRGAPPPNVAFYGPLSPSPAAPDVVLVR